MRTTRLKLSIIALAIITTSISCASFQKRVLQYGNIAQTSLESLSEKADNALLNKDITELQRKEFATLYMLPALTALDELITVTRSWKDGDPIPTQFNRILLLVAQAIDKFTATIKSPIVRTDLNGELNKLRVTINNWLGEMK